MPSEKKNVMSDLLQETKTTKATISEQNSGIIAMKKDFLKKMWICGMYCATKQFSGGLNSWLFQETEMIRLNPSKN